MLKIFLYLIEGFIIGYFDFKFIKKDFNYYLISFFSIIFTLSHVIAEQYLVYDYLSIVITIAILYLMNGFFFGRNEEKKQRIYLFQHL